MNHGTNESKQDHGQRRSSGLASREQKVVSVCLLFTDRAIDPLNQFKISSTYTQLLLSFYPVLQQGCMTPRGASALEKQVRFKKLYLAK